jgi:hypothetical protein
MTCNYSEIMTTPAKKYQNVSYKELIGFSEHNPNRHRVLESIELPTTLSDTSMDKLYLTGYTSLNLNPTGILSVMVCISDPALYSLSPEHTRIEKLIELSTSLQQQTDGLKNTSLLRKRKKIHDLIAASYNGSKMEEKDYLDLYHGLSIMTQNQFILLKETVQDSIEDGVQYDSAMKGEILFSSDPTTWKRDHPVWIADYRGRWVALPTEINAQLLTTFLPQWLTTIEQHGWIVQWPSLDLPKTELVERLSVMPSWKETDKKLLKETLSVRLGKALTLQLFTSWTM